MASILNCFIKAKLLLAAGLSCFSPGLVQSTPAGLHGQLLRIPILPARVSTQKAQLEAVADARKTNGINAIIDWRSMENAQADPIMSSTKITYSVQPYTANHKKSFRKYTVTMLSGEPRNGLRFSAHVRDEARTDLRHGRPHGTGNLTRGN